MSFSLGPTATGRKLTDRQVEMNERIKWL
jgi:hypothetical protein